MKLHLNREQATEMDELLDTYLRDLSEEIAGTDNAAYRRILKSRRERLEAIAEELRFLLGYGSREGQENLVPSKDLMAEQSHPGG